VINTVVDPTGAVIAGVNITVQLYTGSTMPGFANGQAINAPISTITNGSGVWSLTLTPNSLISPANTYYLVTERRDYPRFAAQYAIVVPNGAGPYIVSSIVVSPTVVPSPVAITGMQVAKGGSVIASRPEVNLVEGSNVSLSVTDNQAQNRVDVIIAAPNASESSPGAVQLAGDIGGAATAPTVVATHLTSPLPITQGGTGTATQNFVDLTTGQSIAGTKTFTSPPTVPTPTTGAQAVNKSYADSGDTSTLATASAYTDTAAATKLNKASNLADLADSATARQNLGLGTAALKDTPLAGNATSDQVVIGSDSRLADARTPIDGSVTSAKIADGSIVDTDISNTAAIAQAKVSGLVADLAAKLASTTAASTYVAKTSTARNIRDFGVAGTGAEEGAAIQSAITTILATGADVYLPQGTYKCNTSLAWDPTQGSVFATGQVILDFTGLTSGYAITLDCSTSGAAFRAIEHHIGGLRILGPQSDTTTTDGFRFVGSANSSMIALRDVSVNGFRDQFFFDANTWCITFDRVIAGHWARYSLNIDAQANAGENYNFYGCTFFNATNATSGTATAVYTSPTGDPDVSFHACSFDYNNYAVLHQGGKLWFYGCHFESNNANPYILLTRTSNPANPRTTMGLFGGVCVQTETGDGRDHLIEVTATSVAGVYLSMYGVAFDTYARTTTVFKNLSSFLPRVVHHGCQMDNTGSLTQSAVMGQYTNLLVNGDFESSSSFGASAAFPLYPGIQWTKGGTLTYTFDTSVFRTGTKSVKIVGTGVAVGSNLQQMIAVIPGRELIVTGWIKVAAMTGGSTVFRVSWYLSDYTTRTVVAYLSPTITAVQDWTAYAAQLVVPAGITAALIDVANTNLNGTIYVDDVCATLL